jgi:hypothetical protein
MTEKDYELVAQAFYRVKKDELKPEFVFGALVRELQVEFSTEDPHFDRKKFVAMCHK